MSERIKVEADFFMETHHISPLMMAMLINTKDEELRTIFRLPKNGVLLMMVSAEMYERCNDACLEAASLLGQRIIEWTVQQTQGTSLESLKVSIRDKPFKEVPLPVGSPVVAKKEPSVN